MVDTEGRFVNEEFPFVPNWKNIWKWKSLPSPQAKEKKGDLRRVPIVDPRVFLQGTEDGLVWLGHACFFLRKAGLSILIDPVFYPLPLVSQFVEIENPLIHIEELDYLLISHDHRDHCDKQTLRQVCKLFPNVKILTGLNMDVLLGTMLPATATITAGGWYQRLLDTADLKIDFLPSRHWARRGVFDTNRRLWGAFMIAFGATRIYFGGDSGYGSHYLSMRELYGDVSVAILGIGAYSPRWFMHPSHMAPEEAVVAFDDTGAGKLLPMHYGKYDLSDEPPGEPRELIIDLMQQRGRSHDLLLPAIGEVVEI